MKSLQNLSSQAKGKNGEMAHQRKTPHHLKIEEKYQEKMSCQKSGHIKRIKHCAENHSLLQTRTKEARWLRHNGRRLIMQKESRKSYRKQQGQVGHKSCIERIRTRERLTDKSMVDSHGMRNTRYQRIWWMQRKI